MAFTVSSLEKIAASGGGLVIDGSGYTVDSLAKIAAAASKSGAKVVITNTSGFTVDSLVKIGTAGKGNVILDTTKK